MACMLRAAVAPYTRARKAGRWVEAAEWVVGDRCGVGVRGVGGARGVGGSRVRQAAWVTGEGRARHTPARPPADALQARTETVCRVHAQHCRLAHPLNRSVDAACPSPSSRGRAQSHVTVFDAAPVTSTRRGARHARCQTQRPSHAWVEVMPGATWTTHRTRHRYSARHAWRGTRPSHADDGAPIRTWTSFMLVARDAGAVLASCGRGSAPVSRGRRVRCGTPLCSCFRTFSHHGHGLKGGGAQRVAMKEARGLF